MVTARSLGFIPAALAGLALTAAGFFLDLEDPGGFYTVWTGLCIAYSVWTVLVLFGSRAFLIATFALFLTYSVAVVWLFNFMLDLPMSSWRAGWESGRDFPFALGVAIQYLVFFSSLAIAAMAYVPKQKPGPFICLPAFYEVPMAGLALASAAALILTAGFRARDAFILTADLGAMFVVQASSIMIAVLFAAALLFVRPGVGRTTILAILLGTALIVAANGFRFIMVTFALVWGFHALATRRLTPRQAAVIGVMAAFGYLFLIIIAYTRSLGMTFTESLAFALDPDLVAATRYVGGADQINIVAIDYYYWSHRERLLGETYVDALLNIAPNFIRTTLFDTIRPQDYIIETGTFVPDLFRQNNWTIGSHFFVEGIINFGRLGPFVACSVAVPVMAWAECASRRSHAFCLGYLVTAAMGYSLAWYGSSNAFKQTAFAFACGYILIGAGKLLGRPRVHGQSPRTR